MSDVFIGAWHGGLGDNLQLSTLPEEFYKQQGRTTYLWNHARFRNDEIRQLIWDFNPYVRGYKDGDWNAGDLPDLNYSNVAGDHVANIEACHGLKPTNKYPKIYYKPIGLVSYSNTFLVDFTSISINYDHKKLLDKLQEIRETYPDKRFLEVTFSNQLNNSGPLNAYDVGLEKLVVNNIFEYCDYIASAYGIVALSSGASHLSSALQEYHTSMRSICIMSEEWYNRHMDIGKLFIFDNIDYQLI